MDTVFEHNNVPQQVVELAMSHGYIGNVAGVRFYEHPYYGDESPLLAYDTRTGQWGVSHWWELPRFEDIHPNLYPA